MANKRKYAFDSEFAEMTVFTPVCNNIVALVRVRVQYRF